MSWSWISKFIPIATEVTKGINKIITNKERRAKIKKSVLESIGSVYQKQYSGFNKDILLIKSYKPITSRIQAIDITLRRWEYLAIFCEENKIESAIDTAINEKKVNTLINETKAIKKKMDAFAKEANLSWDEGGVSLKTALSNLEDKLEDLKVDLKRKPELKINNIITLSRQAQEETKEFYEFWDNILKEMVVEAGQASKSFRDSLKGVLNKQVEIISTTYPTESWSDIVGDTLDKIGELDFDSLEKKEDKSVVSMVGN